MNRGRRGAISATSDRVPSRIETSRSMKNSRKKLAGVTEAPPTAGRSSAATAPKTVSAIIAITVRRNGPNWHQMPSSATRAPKRVGCTARCLAAGAGKAVRPGPERPSAGDGVVTAVDRGRHGLGSLGR